MGREEIPVGGYVPLGDLRAYCVESVRRKRDCELCAFQNTERCGQLECGSLCRTDKTGVFFVIKLNKP